MTIKEVSMLNTYEIDNDRNTIRLVLNNHTTIRIDREDLSVAIKYFWAMSPNGACTIIDCKTVFLHRLLVAPSKHKPLVIFLDKDRTNCTKRNLFRCDRQTMYVIQKNFRIMAY